VQVPCCCWCKATPQIRRHIQIVWSYREASKHQPSEVGSFSYWFDKPWFHTEGRLAAVLIIPFSWCSQLGGHLHAIKQFFWRRYRGERGFLQGDSLASNLLLCYCFALFCFACILYSCYFCLPTVSFARIGTPENTKLCDFTSTNNNDFICTSIAPPAPEANFYEIKPALLNLVMK
jgi:hypothetical protein